MDKATLANYLVNLYDLMQFQEANGLAKSETLVREYERQWGELKSIIEEEEKNAQ